MLSLYNSHLHNRQMYLVEVSWSVYKSVVWVYRCRKLVSNWQCKTISSSTFHMYDCECYIMAPDYILINHFIITISYECYIMTSQVSCIIPYHNHSSSNSAISLDLLILVLVKCFQALYVESNTYKIFKAKHISVLVSEHYNKAIIA